MGQPFESTPGEPSTHCGDQCRMHRVGTEGRLGSRLTVRELNCPEPFLHNQDLSSCSSARVSHGSRLVRLLPIMKKSFDKFLGVGTF